MKALIIGFGSIGKRHVNNLIQNTDCEIMLSGWFESIHGLPYRDEPFKALPYVLNSI